VRPCPLKKLLVLVLSSLSLSVLVRSWLHFSCHELLHRVKIIGWFSIPSLPELQLKLAILVINL
jgi:hypothetical protein